MKQLNLNIGDIQHDVLKQFAEGNDMSPEQYATNIIVGWLNAHIKGFYSKKLEETSFDTLEEKFGKVEIKDKK